MHLWLQHQPGSVAQKVRAEDSEEEGERGTVVLEKTLESPLEFKKIQLVHPEGNQS